MDGARQWKTGVLRLGPIEMEVDHDRDPALPTQPGLRTLRGAGRRGPDAPRALRRSQPRNLRCRHRHRPQHRREIFRAAQPQVRRARAGLPERRGGADPGSQTGGRRLYRGGFPQCPAQLRGRRHAAAEPPVAGLLRAFPVGQHRHQLLPDAEHGRLAPDRDLRFRGAEAALPAAYARGPFLRHHGAHRAACRLLAIGHPHPRRTGRRR